MARYLMTYRRYRSFVSRGYSLICYWSGCGAPITVGDTVESKARGGGKGPKLYHADCYDRLHLQFVDGEILNGKGDKIEFEKE